MFVIKFLFNKQDCIIIWLKLTSIFSQLLCLFGTWHGKFYSMQLLYYLAKNQPKFFTFLKWCAKYIGNFISLTQNVIFWRKFKTRYWPFLPIYAKYLTFRKKNPSFKFVLIFNFPNFPIVLSLKSENDVRK